MTEIVTQPYPIQPNLWMDPTHIYLCVI